MEEFLWALLKSFLSLFIILDPFLAVAVFVPMTHGVDRSEQRRQALVASGVACVLLISFLFLGLVIFSLLSITMPSFIIGGGIILLLLGIQATLGTGFMGKHKDKHPSVVIIGTPLLCGPGAMTTVVYLSTQHGLLIPFLASVLVCIVTYVMLLFAQPIARVVGDRMIEIISRVLGLVLAAIAIEFIKEGVLSIIEEYNT